MNLIIDTIGRDGLVVLAEGEEIADKMKWRSDFNQSEELLVKIEELLEKAEVKRTDLSGIAVVNGPGSYTGIRVGVATGNALGFALGVPVVGVSFLDILVRYGVDTLCARQMEHFSMGHNRIIALVSSIADKYYYGIYKRRGSEAKLIGDYGNEQLADILRRKRGVGCVTGELSEKDQESLADGVKYVTADYAADGVLEALAGLSARGLAEADENSLCEPVYINRPNITPAK